MSSHLDPGVVVVTGASSGIGAACAEEFAKAGYHLALGARRLDRLEQLAPKLEALGAKSIFFQTLDVCDEASSDQFIESVLKKFSNQVDVLINSAGLARAVDALHEGKTRDWEMMINTNVLGLARISRGFTNPMIQQNSGHIINIGSIAGFHTYAGGAVYAGSKHAVKAISGAMRLELSGTNIRVTELDPGMVETEFSNVRLDSDEKADAVYKGMIPLTAKDIAECAFFAATRPAHVNLDHIIIMPTAQASVYKTHRTE